MGGKLGFLKKVMSSDDDIGVGFATCKVTMHIGRGSIFWRVGVLYLQLGS